MTEILRAFWKEKRPERIAVLVSGILFAVIFWIYEIPVEIAGYAFLLVILWNVIWFTLVFIRYEKRQRVLEENQEKIRTEAEGFPEMPGIKEALKQLKDEGYLLAVASSSPAYAIKDALKSLDMEKYFTVVMSGDYVEHPKPAPDTFLVTAEKLGMEPEDCLVVEDSTNGGGAARAAGMKCIWFHNPDSGRQDIPDAVLEFPAWTSGNVEKMLKILGKEGE